MPTLHRTCHEFTTLSMDTLVHVTVVSDQPRASIAPGVQRALAWFGTVEGMCTRFDPSSEVMQLGQRVGVPVPASRLLIELVAFALEMADATGGAFDPTIGAALEQRGFDVNYRTGKRVRSHVDAHGASFRDVRVDRTAGTIVLRRPLVLDLNALAKGLAIDLAVHELHGLTDFSVEAGGDLYVRGRNPNGEAWRVGIQHPRADGLLARTLHISDAAVCTSGDYERGQHIIDARTRDAVSDLASVSVVAPTALAADGLSTAAMVLGRERGLGLLEQHGVAGVLMGQEGSMSSTTRPRPSFA